MINSNVVSLFQQNIWTISQRIKYVDVLQEQSMNRQIWKSNNHFYTNCHVKPMIVNIDLNTLIFDIDSNGQRGNS
jgi:hypothetical protein